MSVIYHGYSRMPTNKDDSFPFLELQQSIQELKQYTSYKPRTKDNVRFKFTGTEINQINHQTPLLQRSLIEGMQLPIFEYNGRTTHIEPRPNYVVNVDLTNTSLIKLGKKQYG